MKFSKDNILSSPLRLIRNLEDVVYDLVESLSWGKSSTQSVVTSDDIKDWFKELPTSTKKKIFFGVVARIQEIETEHTRLFQGVFDKKEKCITSRQLIARSLSDELEKEFGTTDLLIYSTDLEFISKYQRN